MSAVPLPGHSGTPGTPQELRILQWLRWQLGQRILAEPRELERRVQRTLVALLARQRAQHKWEAPLQLGPHRSAAFGDRSRRGIDGGYFRYSCRGGVDRGHLRRSSWRGIDGRHLGSCCWCCVDRRHFLGSRFRGLGFRV